jgi:hypothetical protein
MEGIDIKTFELIGKKEVFEIEKRSFIVGELINKQ